MVSVLPVDTSLELCDRSLVLDDYSPLDLLLRPLRFHCLRADLEIRSCEEMIDFSFSSGLVFLFMDTERGSVEEAWYRSTMSISSNV